MGFLHEKKQVFLGVEWVFLSPLEVLKKVVIKDVKTVRTNRCSIFNFSKNRITNAILYKIYFIEKKH